jgi:Macrocin-O-methyltransferase (TylF)
MLPRGQARVADSGERSLKSRSNLQLLIKKYIARVLNLIKFVFSKAGSEYGITPLVRLKLAIRVIKNEKHFGESASKWWEHLAIIDELFKVPKSLKGDVVECGCWDGHSTTSLSLACRLVGRKLFACDSFEGTPEPRPGEEHEIRVSGGDHYIWEWEKGVCGAKGGLDGVKRNMERCGDIGVCTFVKGYFEDALRALETDSIVLIFEDTGLRSSVEDCVRYLWPKLQEGCCFFSGDPNSINIVGLFYDVQWWKDNLNAIPPGFFGSGHGINGVVSGLGIGYSKKFDPEKIREEGKVVRLEGDAPLSDQR